MIYKISKVFQKVDCSILLIISNFYNRNISFTVTFPLLGIITTILVRQAQMTMLFNYSIGDRCVQRSFRIVLMLNVNYEPKTINLIHIGMKKEYL